MPDRSGRKPPTVLRLGGVDRAEDASVDKVDDHQPVGFAGVTAFVEGEAEDERDLSCRENNRRVQQLRRCGLVIHGREYKPMCIPVSSLSRKSLVHPALVLGCTKQ